ncbi:hypothetical protein V6Z11_A09G016800 [Gossypium hirsutum]
MEDSQIVSCFHQIGIPCQQFGDKVDQLSKSKDSSKRKRDRKTSPDETEACKHCNCRRSRCLKLYCECFAAGIYCEDCCACENCVNKPDYEDIVLDIRHQIELRNPLAFAPPIVNPSNDSPNVTGDENLMNTPSARHKRGCKCKRSKCLKKYCECYRVESEKGTSFHCYSSALSPKQPCQSKEIDDIYEIMADGFPDYLMETSNPINTVNSGSSLGLYNGE